MSALTLAAWQDAFAHALVADHPQAEAPPALARLIAQPGFAVYRNTVLTGCIDALQSNFPAIERLVGEQWFRAAAAIYVRSHLPQDPALLLYGADFAEFLASFEPAREYPYLPDVAHVDRLWSEAHAAADDDVLAASALSNLAEHDMNRFGLELHPAVRWAWSDDHPIHTLWIRNRDGAPDVAAPIEWTGEGVLLTRPHGAVTNHPIGRAGVALLAACADGCSIAAAVAAAHDADVNADLPALIGLVLSAGAFARLHDTPTEEMRC